MKRKLIPLVVAALVLALSGLAAWHFHGRNSAQADALVLFGNIDIRQVQLAFNGSERIASMPVKEGDAVKKGQLLATLNTDRLKHAVDLQRAQGDIYRLCTDTLTLNKSDFNRFNLAGDLGIRLSSPVDLVLGAGFTRTSHPSEYRNLVDQNNLPITQQTTLSTVPLTAALRWYLTATGRQSGRFVWIPARVTPYVGVGGGMMHYQLTQTGSFVDFTDSSVFDATLQSQGWAPVGLAMAGIDYSLGTRVFVNADARYLLAKGTLNQSFSGFDGIDLSGAQFSLGLHVRL